MKPAALVLALAAAFAGVSGAHAAEADPTIAKQLKALGYEYEVDEDGDYKLLMATGDNEERSQIVYIRSTVETYGKHRVRELWSYAYRSPGDSLSAVVANRLLDASNALILGSWVKQERNAVYVAKLPADASTELLEDAISAAAVSADAMEVELAEDPASDDY
ncbi:hypothetical protein [Pseudoxanthomonas beigongshangi]|jgi:hypothetical protein